MENNNDNNKDNSSHTVNNTNADIMLNPINEETLLEGNEEENFFIGWKEYFRDCLLKSFIYSRQTRIEKKEIFNDEFNFFKFVIWTITFLKDMVDSNNYIKIHIDKDKSLGKRQVEFINDLLKEYMNKEKELMENDELKIRIYKETLGKLEKEAWIYNDWTLFNNVKKDLEFLEKKIKQTENK